MEFVWELWISLVPLIAKQVTGKQYWPDERLTLPVELGAVLSYCCHTPTP